MVRRSWNCELVRGLFLVHAGDSACFEFLAVNTIALTGMGDGVIFAPALPGSWNNLLPVSLVPRPRGRREKWPGIHCLRMRKRFRKSSANDSDYGQVHVVVMRRNNQTRYTACSVAAVFTIASIIRDTRGDTTRTTYNHRRFYRYCACS